MTVEVKTRLTLDDNASAALSHVKEGFEGAHQAAEKAKEGFSAINLVLTEMAEHAFERGIEKVKEFGSELIEAASHGQDVETRLAGMTTAVQGVPWAEAKAGATEYFDKLHEMSIRTMQPIDDIEAGFNRLVEIQGASAGGIAESFQQTEQMATIARVLGTSVENIGSQFAFMEEGSLKVKSQMYQLLQPTGVFEGHLGKVTEWWQKLTQEGRADILAKGLDKLSASMEKAPPTFSNSVNQLKNVWDQVEEDLGGGIVGALQPQIQQLSKYLSESSGEIKHYGQILGEKVGEWVKEAAKLFKEGFQFMEDHAAEIWDDMKQAWGYAKEVMEFIIAHKEILGALAIGRSEIGRGVANAAVGSFGTLAKAGAGMAGGIGVEATAGLAGAAVSATLALGVMAAAVGSVALAVDQWDKLMAVAGHGSDNQQNYAAMEDSFKKQIAAPDMKQWGAEELAEFDRQRKSFTALAETLHLDSHAAADLADSAYEAHHAAESIIRPLEGLGETFDSLLASNDMGSDVIEEKVGQLADAFGTAAYMHNAAAEQYIGNLLTSDSALQTAFLNSGVLTAEGYAELASHIGDSAKEFKDRLMTLAGAPGTKPCETKHQMNFSGGQTFKIQQDFRDQDPDRIAVVFRNDVLKAATNRIQAVTSTPFGV